MDVTVLSMGFTILGSFIIIFKMLSLRTHDTVSKVSLNNKISCLAKVEHLFTDTSAALSGETYK